MKGKTHFIFGVSTGCLAAALICPDDLISGVGFMGLSALGSLFPDIDCPTSMLGKKVKPISFGVNKLLGHRGITHTPFLYILLGVAAYFLLRHYDLLDYMILAYGFGFGVLGHLFLDTITKGGIMWLYPYKRKRYHLTNMPSGTKYEFPVLIGICLFFMGAFAFAVYSSPEIIEQVNALIAGL